MSDYYIDYSQYAQFKWCEWKWAETYVNGVRETYTGPRKDALCVGGLTHEGLAQWYLHQQPRIPESAITQYTPSKETLDLAQALLLGYVARYPSDPWHTVWSERAVRVPLLEVDDANIWLVAKLDITARAEQDLLISSGDGDEQITMPYGWSSVEFKTKGANMNRANWKARFQVNKQVSFQQLALQHDLRDVRRAVQPVRGVLVNVLEKPPEVRPRRKCKEASGGCGGSSYLTDWGLLPDGRFVCPGCGAHQRLDTEVRDRADPLYFRMYIERSPEDLRAHLEEIREVALDMHAIRLGQRTPRMAEHNCVDDLARWKCGMYEAHASGQEVLPVLAQKYERVEDPLAYIGLDQEM